MSDLQLNEAVLLGTAFIQHQCRQEQIPVLFLKGPTATVLGARPRGPSTDIDILVRPRDQRRISDLLKSKGWLVRGEDWDEYYSSHSLTMFHPTWPCDIDIHHRFPGIDSNAEAAFHTLYEERSSVPIAGIAIDVPGWAGTICIQALHALRNPRLVKNKASLDHLVDHYQNSNDSTILDFSLSIGALAAMRPFMDRILELPAEYNWPKPSNEWLARTTARTRGSIRFMELVDAPLRFKLTIISRFFHRSNKTIDQLTSSREYATMKLTTEPHAESKLSYYCNVLLETIEFIRKRGKVGAHYLDSDYATTTDTGTEIC